MFIRALVCSDKKIINLEFPLQPAFVCPYYTLYLNSFWCLSGTSQSTILKTYNPTSDPCTCLLNHLWMINYCWTPSKYTTVSFKNYRILVIGDIHKVYPLLSFLHVAITLFFISIRKDILC